MIGLERSKIWFFMVGLAFRMLGQVYHVSRESGMSRHVSALEAIDNSLALWRNMRA